MGLAEDRAPFPASPGLTSYLALSAALPAHGLESLRAPHGAASNPDNTESNLYTYDIFIEHCFGSYFDILKELTYSPKMGEQFNFAENTSTRLRWDTSGMLVFPDEVRPVLSRRSAARLAP